MSTIGDEIVKRTEAGEFRKRFREYCLAWKEFCTPRQLASVVRHAIDDARADDLYKILFDDRYRVERQSSFGINALRADLRAGRSFFAEKQPDLLRYIQVTFLEQTASDDPDTIFAHRQHCQGFADFLQLDRLPEERLEMGLERVLHRFFPIHYDPADDRDEWTRADSPATIQLISYEVGSWSCLCGESTSLAQRYKYACGCGSTRGIGRITADTQACTGCGQVPDYVTCHDCGTRVGLDLLHQARKPGAHPSIYRVPLTVELAVERAGQPTETRRFPLMQIPVPLGLKEREDTVFFELPDMLWLGEYSDIFASGSLLNLSDIPRYDRQTEVCKILEAAFRRSLLGYKGSYRSFGGKLVKGLGYRRGYGANRTDLETDLEARYSRGFERRIGANLGAPGGDASLLRFLEISADVAVAASPLLRENALILNRRLIDEQVLSTPHLLHFETRLGDGDVITPDPPQLASELTSGLEESGIIRLGTCVKPGQVLVGIACRPPEEELTPEERLLRSIFGDDKELLTRNRSLVMTGQHPGHVVAEHLNLDPAADSGIPPITGRLVEVAAPWDRQVRITVAVDQPVEVGDVLVGDSGTTGVVCGIAGGAALQKSANIAAEPDVIVSPDHPWAPVKTQTLRAVRIRLDHRSLVGQTATSHATGPYSLFHQPLPADGDRPQELTGQAFRWLIARGARNLAFELYGPRSDCAESRRALYESLMRSGDAHVGSWRGIPEWSSLHDSPSHAVRRWDRLLRSACVRPELSRNLVMLKPVTDEEVLASSCGEVKRDATLNYRTLRPEKEGLFCEKIFGPVRDWECYCGKYRGMEFKGTICERCGVEITLSSVRLQRFGHIELPAPVIHPWYLHGDGAARLAELLDLSEEDLQNFANHTNFLLPHQDRSSTQVGELLLPADWIALQRSKPKIAKQAVTGGEAIEMLLLNSLTSKPGALAAEGIILRRLPVLPPDLRPMIRLDGNRWGTSDLNDLYRNVLDRSARARRLTDIGAPEGIVMDARAILQTHVNRLFDNESLDNPSQNLGRKLLSISGNLERLSYYFEHRAIDYSALTSLVAGDAPGIDTALLPFRLAWNLFRPLILHKLTEVGAAKNMRHAKRMADSQSTDAMQALADVCAKATILIWLPSEKVPFLAMRTGLTSELALKFHPALLDQIGWGLLGKHVKIFSVLTSEAVAEAKRILSPSQLLASPGNPEHVDHLESSKPVFGQSNEEHTAILADAILMRKPLSLTLYDDLALQNTEWLARQGEGIATMALDRFENP